MFVKTIYDTLNRLNDKCPLILFQRRLSRVGEIRATNQKKYVRDSSFTNPFQ